MVGVLGVSDIVWDDEVGNEIVGRLRGVFGAVGERGWQASG